MMKFVNCFYLVIVSLLFGCAKEDVFLQSSEQLGTKINITIVGKDNDYLASVFDDVFNEIERIEDLMSPVRENSDVSKLNGGFINGPIQVSPETYDIVKKSYSISMETGGAFDVTFPPVGKLWNYKKTPFVVPAKWRIRNKLKLVDYKFIQFSEDDHSIFLSRRGVRVGLGGIAKGYAIKKGIDVLKKKNIKSAIVEAGGDLQVIGDKQGEPWKIGLIHPRSKDIIIALKLSDGETVATSGDYERFVMVGKKRYHHIIDPKSGYPAKNFSSVSVICKDPVEADAYSTAFFVMGMEKAKKFLFARKDLKVIFMDLQMNIWASEELKDKIKVYDDSRINWF